MGIMEMGVSFLLGILSSFSYAYQIYDSLDRKKFCVWVVSLYTHFRGLYFFKKGVLVNDAFRSYHDPCPE